MMVDPRQRHFLLSLQSLLRADTPAWDTCLYCRKQNSELLFVHPFITLQPLIFVAVPSPYTTNL